MITGAKKKPAANTNQDAALISLDLMWQTIRANEQLRSTLERIRHNAISHKRSQHLNTVQQCLQTIEVMAEAGLEVQP